MAGLDRKRRRPSKRPLPSRARAKASAAATLRPFELDQAANGLSFAGVLHKCLAAGIILIDAHLKVASINDHAQQLLGLKLRPAALPSFASLPGALRSVVRQAQASGSRPADGEVELRVAGRRPVALRVSTMALEPGRKNSGVLLVLNDLTPARQIEEHVLQLDRLASIGTLAAGMAHEIKNALVAGKTFVDLLLEKHQDAELVEVVRREMGRIDALVSHMRKFAGPARPAFCAVRLHEILDHSLRLVQPRFEERLVSVNRSFLAESDMLRGDDYQLQQAFVNLFLNALDAMGPNGTLSVATNLLPAAKPQLQLTVKDTGVGISPENLARLFEPFFTTKPNGTGLGLAITRRIVQDHHGAISVQSRLGKGTTFQILLPAAA